MIGRGVTSARLLCRTASVASSSSAVAGRRGKQTYTIVQLLQDVDSLGLAGDRVEVATGRARNHLVGTGRAKFIPWKTKAEREAIRQTARLIDGEEGEFNLASATSSRAAETSASSGRDITGILDGLPSTLLFRRRAISPDSPALYGRLSLRDVTQLLTQEHGLTDTEVELRWKENPDEDNMKEIGKRKAVIKSRNGEERDITVEVAREEDKA